MNKSSSIFSIKYEESTTYYLSLILLSTLLIGSNPGMFFAFTLSIIILAIGINSIMHISSGKHRSTHSQALVVTYIFVVMFVVGIIASHHQLSIGIAENLVFLIFPLLNIISCVRLYRWYFKLSAEKAADIFAERHPSNFELFLGTTLIIILFILLYFEFHMHWSVMASMLITAAAIIQSLIQIHPAKRIHKHKE